MEQYFINMNCLSRIKLRLTMNKIILTFSLIAIFASACTIDPCLTKGQFVNGYETFTGKVAKNHEDYSKSDWEKKDEQMDKFVGECYEQHAEKLTSEEKKKFWIKYFKYKFDRHGRNVMRAIQSDMEEFDLELNEDLEDIFDDVDGDLEDIFKEVYGEDIEKALDDFKKGIEDFSDKIKEWLEEGK